MSVFELAAPSGGKIQPLKTLAAAVAFSAVSSVASAATLINGNFEDTSSSVPGNGLIHGQALADLATAPGSSWDVYTELVGWQSTIGPGIEVQTNRTLSTIDSQGGGQHYIELDSHPSGGSNSNMFQDLVLDAGNYIFSFFYSPRDSRVDSNGIKYFADVTGGTGVSGLVIGPDAGPPVTAVGVWTQITAEFSVLANDTAVRLGFQADGTENTYGGFIDSVSLNASPDNAPPIPLPAGGWLLVTGLVGLGVAKRRKAKKS